MRKIIYFDIADASAKKHIAKLPPPVSPLEFCRIWFGLDKLSPRERSQVETWGVKKIYTNLLAGVLDVSPSSVQRWSLGCAYNIKSGIEFEGMPKAYQGYLGSLLVSKDNTDKIAELSKKIEILEAQKQALLEQQMSSMLYLKQESPNLQLTN